MTNRVVHTLNINLTSITSDEPISDVPCGSCHACCLLLSPYLTPEEVASGKYPISLINPDNPATGEGPTVVMFKNEFGGCSQLIDGKCNIYNDRPIACKQYDCRKGHHAKTHHIAKEKFGIQL
jgi:Fe-S-cluster containining protein